MQFTTRCSRHRGFTALELIIVLVIGFSIIAVSASKMGELYLSSKITRATSSILELAIQFAPYGALRVMALMARLLLS